MSHGLEQLLTASRDRAVAWLAANVSDAGVPLGSDSKAGWGRLPWALALSGKGALASRVIAWAEREALDADGGFVEGPARGTGIMNAYSLSHLAIGAWLVQRYDVAGRIMAKLETMIHPETGGVDTGHVDPDGVPLQDLLMTAQVGQAALATGRIGIATRTHAWVATLLDEQPDYPRRLYTFRAGRKLLTELPSNLAWLGHCDFSQPRQAYYNPGIAAAFLASYAMQTGDASTLATADLYLAYNRRGTRAQFDDLQSMQLCKFGWGAALYALACGGEGLDDVVTMGEWFLARQGSDGAWSPSPFFVPEPGVQDRMMKTAEHVMEINVILAALGAAASRGGSQRP